MNALRAVHIALWPLAPPWKFLQSWKEAALRPAKRGPHVWLLN